jgi:hypothetical protein
MILKVCIDDQTYDIDVAEEMLEEAREFYDKMDRDMDKGWQMSRFWVEKPDLYQRCQIIADKILGAILSRVPHVQEVVVDTSGDITLTEIIA